MPRSADRWVLGCVAVVATASGCAEREHAPGGELAGDAAALHTSAKRAQSDNADPTTLAKAPPSLRAAAIVAMQRGAGPEYDLDWVRDDAGGRTYEGELVAMARVLRVDAAGAAIARGYDDEAELGLRLERAGCVGDTSEAGADEPEVAQNRVSYARALGERAVEEWYLAGPLGLEQGFTIERNWGCAGALELDVAVRGARVEAGRREGELGLVSDASGERYVYGEFAAWDAAGKALAARMERREGGVRLVVDGAGAVFPVVVDPLVWTEQSKLVAEAPDASDHFGASVALDGDTAIVGAPFDYDLGIKGGSAYIFVRHGATWTQQARIVGLDTAPDDLFGSSVAIAGDTALVGAPYADHAGGLSAGSAYVFVRSGATWAQQSKLVASDAAASNGFGSSVALDGDTALVGAPYFGAVGGGNDTGVAYVFVRSGVAWTEQTKLVANDAAVRDHFGAALALADDTALVGAYGDDHAGGTDAGSAYVFVRSGEAWTEQAKLTASDSEPSNYFGTAVALDGDTALVGSLDGSNAGGAYVFVRNSATWAEQAKLMASDSAPDDYFGVAVALDGDAALVGARFDDHAGGSSAGSAYAFVRSGASWAQQSKLIASDSAPDDYFGTAVALSGDTALVGSSSHDIANETDAGGAYVFVLEDKLDLGAACNDDLACASGHCADGVCCESECVDGSCAGGVCDDSGQGGGGVGGAGAGVGGGASTGELEGDGCSCRMTGAPTDSGAPPPAWIALAGLMMSARLRRRRAA